MQNEFHYLPPSHVFLSDSSFTPSGHAHLRLLAVGRQKVLQPPLAFEQTSFTKIEKNVLSVSSDTLCMVNNTATIQLKGHAVE